MLVGINTGSENFWILQGLPILAASSSFIYVFIPMLPNWEIK